MSKTESVVPAVPQTETSWQGVWAFGDRCDVKNPANPCQGKNVVRLLVDDKAQFAIQENSETPKPVSMPEALEWLGKELTERDGTDHDEDYWPSALGFVLFRAADAIEGKTLPRLEGNKVILPTDLAEAVQTGAAACGVSEGELIGRAILKHVGKAVQS